MYDSLYLHVPFCRGKCAYCAFYSEPSASENLRRRWLDGIKSELRRYREELQPLQSVFVGGGTPSLLTAAEWRELCGEIRSCCMLAPDCEWSVEANPESLTPELLETWLASGVNRVSIGVQSFQDHLRRRIGRCGHLARLPELVSFLRQAGRCVRWNLDLIFNIPGESLREWEEDLEQALQCQPGHLSCYALTIEEGTRLAGSFSPSEENFPAEENFLDFWDRTDELLAKAGIHRYEISNFSRTGEECRHNYAIWKGGTYLGIGPAASSFDGTTRRTNVSSLEQWLAGVPPEMDFLPAEERAAEILATGMRTVRGWQWEEFLRCTGRDARVFRVGAWERLEHMGLTVRTPVGVAPTPKGLLFNDTIAEELL